MFFSFLSIRDENMYKEDEYTELKSILTKEIKKIVAFANSGGGKFILV